LRYTTRGYRHLDLNTYYLYGLRIRSWWPLPSPTAIGACWGEVELVNGPAGLFAAASAEVANRLSATSWFCRARLQDGSEYVHWADLFEFLISSNGRRIVGRFFSESTVETFQTYLLGQVISYALLKQGIEPLHATVLVIDGRALALLGDSGYGKSTLGAAFLQAGASLLTDDLLVVRDVGERWIAYPGPARIKLFREAVQAFLGDEAIGTPMNPLTSKLIVPLGLDKLARTAVPLKAIYLLPPPTTRSQSDKVTIRTRGQRQACVDLIANTFNTVIRTPDRLKQQLNLAVRLATSIPVKSLSYQRELARLPRVVEAVRTDLEQAPV